RLLRQLVLAPAGRRLARAAVRAARPARRRRRRRDRDLRESPVVDRAALSARDSRPRPPRARLPALPEPEPAHERLRDRPGALRRPRSTAAALEVRRARLRERPARADGAAAPAPPAPARGRARRAHLRDRRLAAQRDVPRRRPGEPARRRQPHRRLGERRSRPTRRADAHGMGDDPVMHVGLNLVWLTPGRHGGLEVYARELVARLAERDDVRLTAFVNNALGPWPGVPSELVPVTPARRVEWVRGEQLLLPRAAARAGCELVHSLASTAPLRGRFRRVTTIHDLNYLKVPESHFGGRGLAMRALVPSAAWRSHRIVADSASTR